jgi:hypothetical protein
MVHRFDGLYHSKQVVEAMWGSQSWLQPAFSRLSTPNPVTGAR